MKILFLDIDGVLNSQQYLQEGGYCGLILDPSGMRLLKKIIKDTGARIVLTSSWREHWEDPIGTYLRGEFGKYGMEIFDRTPILRSSREEEIRMWLASYEDIENFVVLDDRMLYAGFLKGHMIKTRGYRRGLDEYDAAGAIAILKGELKL